ncbi:MAG: TRAP-type C4-dicarboxylate transport system, substrate-binding protein [Myxococcales bacterium]|nr:TRAP-type C4-dicarboxylate transport system, substrate-binding protein [Myxococcales bacterium]
MRMRFILVFLMWSSFSTAVGAEERRVLRIATVSPTGTTWARLVESMGNDIERMTNGKVHIKWYFGGIAGDEMEAARRMQAGQLDGLLSGGPYCESAMPTMRVLSIPALFQDRDEAAYVMHLLRPDLNQEAERSGYALMGTTGLGPALVFSRMPIRNMSELRKTRLWAWDLFGGEIAAERKMGLSIEPAAVERASRAYDDNKVDGFISIPAAALAFQWSARARYIVGLRIRYLTACVLISHASLDRLPIEHQNAIRASFAKGDARMEDLGRQQDDELLGGLFARQGLQPVPVSETFRSQFFEAARKARQALGERLVPPDLLARIEHLLADYRAEHASH